MNKLTTFLEEMKKVGENATPAPWTKGCLESNYKVLDSHGSFIVTGYATGPAHTDVDGYDGIINDATFIATARNNWDRLIKMNEILLEACEWYGETEYGNKDNKLARKAIEKCKEIIG